MSSRRSATAPTFSLGVVDTSLGGRAAQTLVPYLLLGLGAALFLRRQLDLKTLLIIGGVAYVVAPRFDRARQVVARDDAIEREIVRSAVPTTVPRRRARAVAEHAELRPHVAALRRHFGDNSVLREALGFLARFVHEYRRATRAARTATSGPLQPQHRKLGALQQMDWTRRMVLNTLATLDLQQPDPRPFRRGAWYVHTSRHHLVPDTVAALEIVLRGMLAEAFDAAGLTPEHFEVPPANSWDEPLAAHWKLR